MSDASKSPSEEIAMGVGIREGGPDGDSAGNDVFEIIMAQKVFNDIADISRSSPARAQGGILLGRMLKNQGASLLLIEGHVVAEHTKGQERGMLFTPDSWQQINSDKQGDVPYSQMVGWFHIQPGAGSTLPPNDKFVEYNCAGRLWQIAYIIDPLSCTEGIFRFTGGEFVASEFKIAADPYGRKPSVLDCLGCINRLEFQDAVPVNKRPVLLLTALAILLSVSNVYYWLNVRALSGQVSRLQQYVSQLENTNQVLTERVNNNQYWHHVVFEGQTLADISNNFYGSEDYVDDIAALNNISDIYDLEVGREILIPKNIKRNELNE